MIAEENDFDAKATMTSQEGCVERIHVVDEERAMDVPPQMFEGQRDILEIHEVMEPETVNCRRYSTGVIDMKYGKAKVQSRYLRTHVSSTHDICKHGKRREDEVVKPWKLGRKKSIEGEDAGKTDPLCVRRNSLGGGCGQISSHRPNKSGNCPPAKREPLVVDKTSVSSTSESSGSKEASLVVRSVDGSSVKRSGQTRKNKETDNSPSDSAVVRKIIGLRNEKTKTTVKKLSEISNAKISKDENAVSALKNVKNGQKKGIEPFSSEDVPEKTLYIVDSSVEKRGINGVQGEIERPSEKKITRTTKSRVKVPKDMPPLSPSSEDKGSRTTKPKSQATRLSSMAKNSSTSPSSAKLTPDSKIKPKKKGIKVTPITRQLSFTRGKVLEPKSEDSTPTWVKFRRRVIPESSKSKTEGRRSMKGKQEKDINGRSNSTESKPEKVVLRHRNVEKKKKLQTLFNNIIEETANKLTEVRKSKVKALVGAFETVISLQDNKSSRELQNQATASTVNG